MKPAAEQGGCGRAIRHKKGVLPPRRSQLRSKTRPWISAHVRSGHHLLERHDGMREVTCNHPRADWDWGCLTGENACWRAELWCAWATRPRAHAAHTGRMCLCKRQQKLTGVTHFERSARRCQARLSLRGEAAVARHKSAEHAFRREVVCYPCSSENLSQYRNRDTARYLAIKCDKWRCCAMLAITRALHSTPQRRA